MQLATHLLLTCLLTVLANLYVYSAPIALASDFISQNESAGIRQPINHPLVHRPRVHLAPPVHPHPTPVRPSTGTPKLDFREVSEAIETYDLLRTDHKREPTRGGATVYSLAHLLCTTIQVTLRTMFASFWLGLAIFGIFEMGNCFTDPFGDDPADLGAYISQGGETYVYVWVWVGGTWGCSLWLVRLLRPSPRTVAGHFMMAAGHGLEADLRCMLESHVPLSRLSRMSGRHIYRGRGTPTARSGGEPERGDEPRPSSVAARSLPSACAKDGCENSPSMTSQVSI